MRQTLRRPLLLLAGSLLLLAPLISGASSLSARARACVSLLRPDTLRGSRSGLRRLHRASRQDVRLVPRDHEIHVDAVWKGSISSTAVVERPSECGYPGFALGEDYLVYANRDDESLHAFLCSGTQPLEYAEEVLRALGEGYAPEPGDEERAAGLGMLLLAAFALAVAAILLRLAARPAGAGSRPRQGGAYPPAAASGAPSVASTSAVCSPSSGDRPGTVGESENSQAGPIARTGPTPG